MDLIERLRSGEDGLEYAAADEIEQLRAVIALYQGTCVHTRRTAYRKWIGERTGTSQPIHVETFSAPQMERL